MGLHDNMRRTGAERNTDGSLSGPFCNGLLGRVQEAAVLEDTLSTVTRWRAR